MVQIAPKGHQCFIQRVSRASDITEIFISVNPLITLILCLASFLKPRAVQSNHVPSKSLDFCFTRTKINKYIHTYLKK